MVPLCPFPTREAKRKPGWAFSVALVLFCAVNVASPGYAQLTYCLRLDPFGPTGLVPQFSVGDVIFSEGVMPGGAGTGIGLDLAWPIAPPGDSTMDVVIPWSDAAGGGTFAQFEFDPYSYGVGVDAVSFDATYLGQGSYLKITAYDSVGVAVGVTQVHTMGPNNMQTFLFTGAGQRVNRIVFQGTEIVATNICFEPNDPVIPTPSVPLTDCIDFETRPLGPVTGPGFSVNWVLFSHAVLPTGDLSRLRIDDQFAPGADGMPELVIDWSLDNAGVAQHAFIYFPTYFGHGPNVVEITAAHSSQCEFVAYDATGTIIDTVVHPGPMNTWSTLTLTSAVGIRRIDIVGAEIGIQKLCYDTFDSELCVSAPFRHVGAITPGLSWGYRVSFRAAIDPFGVQHRIEFTDDLIWLTGSDGVTEFFFNWSLPTGQPAHLYFPESVFFLGPSQVSVVCAATTTLDLVAYDAAGAIVDSRSVTGGPMELEEITLGGDHIREVEFIGTDFWIKEICWEGVMDPTDVDPPAGVRAQAQLFAPSPNPFNPRTEVTFETFTSGPALLEIFDLQGRRVRTLLREHCDPGRYTLTWDSTDDTGTTVASGVYFIRLEVGGVARLRRAALLR